MLYMVTWIPSIYPLYVSIYTSTMDPMGIASLCSFVGFLLLGMGFSMITTDHSWWILLVKEKKDITGSLIWH